jgi:hypothetical protein
MPTLIVASVSLVRRIKISKEHDEVTFSSAHNMPALQIAHEGKQFGVSCLAPMSLVVSELDQWLLAPPSPTEVSSVLLLNEMVYVQVNNAWY